MHYDLSDQYHPKKSLIHHLDPRVKVVFVLLYILSVSLAPEGAWQAFLLFAILLLSALLLSKLGAFFTIRRSLVALPFLLAAFAVPFTVSGDPVYTFPLLGWTITDAGLVRFGSILIRAWLAVQAAILLTATTRFPDLLWALGAMRLPVSLVSTLGFMYRYIFVLADEALRMLRARASRSARTSGASCPPIGWQAKVAGGMVGGLFLRSLERSERIYAAMLSRGYDGQMRMLARFEMTRLDWGVSMLTLFLLSAILAIGYWG